MVERDKSYTDFLAMLIGGAVLVVMLAVLVAMAWEAVQWIGTWVD